MTPRMDDGVWQTEDTSLLLIPETVLICSDNQDNDEDDDEEDDDAIKRWWWGDGARCHTLDRGAITSADPGNFSVQLIICF